MKRTRYMKDLEIKYADGRHPSFQSTTCKRAGLTEKMVLELISKTMDEL
jgi:hypothetical protein